MKHPQAMIAGLLLAAAAVSQPANACLDIAPFVMEDMRQADVVFIGKPVAYERISPDEPDTLSDYGLLTVHAEQVLKGSASGDVVLYWWNSTFAVPETFETSDRVLIAAINSSSNGPPLRGASATVLPTQRPDLLQILQAPCSGPFILPASPEHDPLFQALLRGEPFDEDAYAAGEELERKALPKKSANWWEQNALPAGIIAAALLSFAIVHLRRNWSP